MNSIPPNAAVQQIAKRVLAELAGAISAESSERTIVEEAIALLARHGVTETWYHNCPALVLLGSRSCLSVSGRAYEPSEERVGQTNLVTIDLSPLLGSCWGDCARSYAVEQGRVTANPNSPEYQHGFAVLRELHAAIRRFITPETRFCDLYRFANQRIAAAGCENLDFLQNVGHSIATRLDDRLFLDAHTEEQLGSVACFTFEPHIRALGGAWGFKHEEIYYFDEGGRATVL